LAVGSAGFAATGVFDEANQTERVLTVGVRQLTKKLAKLQGQLDEGAPT
jgi:hypothetical protein